MRTISLLFLLGCTVENDLTEICTTADAALDLEELSVLQDTFAIKEGRDALALRYDGEVPEGATWRLSQVDVLATVPADELDSYEDGQTVSVYLWSGTDPTASEPWSLAQSLELDALTWEPAFLDDPKDTHPSHQVAWWSFDLREIVPEEGMQEREYVVAVGWGDVAEPRLGYSDYELSCYANWTDWGSGFSHNSENTQRTNCSWPMLRVHVELREEREDCG